MWVKIISDNFKDLLDTLKTNPIVIIVIGLMFLSGFFINIWVNSKDDCTVELKIRDEELNRTKDSLYNYKYQSIYYKQLYERNMKQSDSLFKESNKLIRSLTESKNN